MCHHYTSPHCGSGVGSSSSSWAEHSLLDGFMSATWIPSTTLLLPLPCSNLSSDAWPCRLLTTTNFSHPARSYRSPGGYTAIFAELFASRSPNPSFLFCSSYKCEWNSLSYSGVTLGSLALLNFKTCHPCYEPLNIKQGITLGSQSQSEKVARTEE